MVGVIKLLTNFQVANLRHLIKHNTLSVSSVMRDSVSIIKLDVQHFSQTRHHSFVEVAI